MKLQPYETDLIGKWNVIGGKAVEDETCQRIKSLLTGHLQELGRDQSGWDVLYRDPDDGRFWELTYPQSEMHGGGPPRLTCLTPEQANKKYGGIIAK
jgi:hypothetical protein